MDHLKPKHAEIWFYKYIYFVLVLFDGSFATVAVVVDLICSLNNV